MLPCAARSILSPMPYMFFFFNDTATTEIYTLSLHDALPISASGIAARSCFLESAESFHHSGRGRFGRARYAIAEDLRRGNLAWYEAKKSGARRQRENARYPGQYRSAFPSPVRTHAR